MQHGKKRTIIYKQVRRVVLTCRSGNGGCRMSMMFTDQFTDSVPATTPCLQCYRTAVTPVTVLLHYTVSCNTAGYTCADTTQKHSIWLSVFSITSQMSVAVLWSFTSHNEHWHAVNSSSRIKYELTNSVCSHVFNINGFWSCIQREVSTAAAAAALVVHPVNRILTTTMCLYSSLNTQLWPSATYPYLHLFFWRWYVMSRCELDIWPLDLELL